MSDFSAPNQPPAPRYGELDPSRQYQPAPQLPPVQPAPAEQKKPAALGLVALIVAIVVFVLSCAASVGVGIMASDLLGPNMSFQDGYEAGANASPGFALSVLAQIGLGTIFGLWALVQGIFAVVLKRGRGYGVAAIIIAVAAPIISFVVYAMTAVASSGKF